MMHAKLSSIACSAVSTYVGTSALGTCFESSTPILRKLERTALNIQSNRSEITSTTDELSGMSNVSQHVRETCEVACSGEVEKEVTIFFWESK